MLQRDRRRGPARGIILMRFPPSERQRKLPRLRALLAHEQHHLEKTFVVLEADKVRFRPLVPS